MADFGIVVGIDTYPGFTSLRGPRNDADAFYDWLTDPGRGNVLPANVRRLKCNGPPPPNIDAAVPNKQTLDMLFKPFVTNGAANRKSGERLFVYLAGHGFADNNNVDSAALLSADAERGWPAHLAVLAYVDFLQRSATFDEIILLMDACRDANLSWIVSPPQLPVIISSANARKVKVFKGYGTYFGDVSREKDVGGGVYRGVFTLALLDALEHAQPEPDGRLLGSKVKDYFHNVFPTFAVKPTDEAEIDVDDQRDVVFMRYPVMVPAPPPDDGMFYQMAPPPMPSQKAIRVTVPAGDVGKRLVVSGATPRDFTIPLADFLMYLDPGLYKARIDGEAKSVLFEVPVNDAISL